MAVVDMSLDNMIQNNRHKSVRRVGRGRALRGVRGPGDTFRGAGRMAEPPHRGHHGHRGPLGVHGIAKAMRGTRNFPCQNSVLGDRLKAAGTSGVESGTKLQVSNLNAGVSNEDIRRLFSEIGELVRYGIHYDKNGTPCGSAEVVFARRNDAFQAVKRYNNAQLDGNPMKIENVRSIARGRVASRLSVISGANGRRTVLMTPGSGYMRNRPGPGCVRNRPGPGCMRNRPGPGYIRSAAIPDDGAGPSRQSAHGAQDVGVPGCGRDGRRRRHQGRMVEKTAEDLDKELENYQAETSQTV